MGAGTNIVGTDSENTIIHYLHLATPHTRTSYENLRFLALIPLTENRTGAPTSADPSIRNKTKGSYLRLATQRETERRLVRYLQAFRWTWTTA